jgi:hypothetical protein
MYARGCFQKIGAAILKRAAISVNGDDRATVGPERRITPSANPPYGTAGNLLQHGENHGRFGGASLSGSLGANAALPDASPPPELWAASSTAKAAEILIAKFRCSLRGDYRTPEQGPAGPFGGRDRILNCPTGKSKQWLAR